VEVAPYTSSEDCNKGSATRLCERASHTGLQQRVRRVTIASASHLDLLATADRVRLAAAADDIDALHTELCRLRTALADHMRDEGGDLASLTGPAAEVVARGQRHLSALVGELLDASAPGSASQDDQCRCLQR